MWDLFASVQECDAASAAADATFLGVKEEGGGGGGIGKAVDSVVGVVDGVNES